MNHRGHYSWVMALVCAALALPSVAAQARVRAPGGPPPPQAQPANTQAPITTLSFDRYQVILSRMPFGDETAMEVAAAEAARKAASGPPPDSFTKTLKLSAITRNHFNGKIQAGLTDTATKKNYFLYEGDSEDGIELLKVEFDNEKALLRKGDEKAWLDMKSSAAVAVVPAPVPSPRVAPGMRPMPAAKPPEPAPEDNKPRLTGEALKKHLESYQMDLIRAGGRKGPPLPMTLTPEMDKQLVEEGVLPPAE